MSWTQTDLDNLEVAIIAKNRGQRIVKATIAGKYIEYGDVPLSDMLALRTDMQFALGLAQRRTYAKNGGRSS
ncbi:MAG: hypothetical protein M0P69_08720 [Bacteroidales bacterium]|nr:hypothetical protein [Bacteroidales bacterium]